jgi:hypothetical protein
MMLSLVLLLSFAARCHFAVVDILLVFSILLLLSFCCWRFAVSFAVVVIHSCAGVVILLLLSFCCFCHFAAVVIHFVVVICCPRALTCVIFALSYVIKKSLTTTTTNTTIDTTGNDRKFLKTAGRSSAPGWWRGFGAKCTPGFSLLLLVIFLSLTLLVVILLLAPSLTPGAQGNAEELVLNHKNLITTSDNSRNNKTNTTAN